MPIVARARNLEENNSSTAVALALRDARWLAKGKGFRNVCV